MNYFKRNSNLNFILGKGGGGGRRGARFSDFLLQRNQT